jgi:hypothetical protein
LNRNVSTKTPNVIFLIIVLVAGTFAAFTPSFLIGVNAQSEPYYGYNSYEPTEYPPDYADREYNSYEPYYEMDDDRKLYGNNNYEPREYPSYQPDYKPEYPSDNNYKSKKDSKSVSLNKLKCINNNVNINGNNNGTINVGNSGKSATGSGTDEGYLGVGSPGGNYGEGYDNGYKKQKDQGFSCIINNNNNNTNVVSGGGNITDGNGNVNTCDENVRACFDALLNDEELQDLEDAFPFSITIMQTDPQPSITITIQSLDDFCEAIQETLGPQNISLLTIVVEEILIKAEIVITSAELQGLIRCIAEALDI